MGRRVALEPFRILGSYAFDHPRFPFSALGDDFDDLFVRGNSYLLPGGRLSSSRRFGREGRLRRLGNLLHLRGFRALQELGDLESWLA